VEDEDEAFQACGKKAATSITGLPGGKTVEEVNDFR